MYRPNACGEASELPCSLPSANGSPLAWAWPARSCAAMSASSVPGETGNAPACRIAWISSASATAPVSYRLNVSSCPWAMYARAHRAAVARSACTRAAGAPLASSASAISAAPQSMSLFHWVAG